MKKSDLKKPFLGHVHILFLPLLAALAIATVRIFRTLTKPSIKHSAIPESPLLKGLINRLGIDSRSLLTGEGGRITYYHESNSGVESFCVSGANETLEIPPSSTAIYTFIPASSAFVYSLSESLSLTFLIMASTSPKEKQYLRKSLRKISRITEIAKKSLLIHAGTGKTATDSYIIRYFKNTSTQPVTFMNEACIAYHSIKDYMNPKSDAIGEAGAPKKKNMRTIVFYIDNLSRNTYELVKKNPAQYPTLHKYFFSAHSYQPRYSSSLSNWTFPAACALLSGMRYEQHGLYHPKTKPYFKINSTVEGSPSSASFRDHLNKRYSWSFSSGTNWRNKPEHGLNLIVDHALTNPPYDELYSCIGHTFKQLDIAGEDSSFHFVSIMDAHHPIKISPLPAFATSERLPVASENNLEFDLLPKSKLKASVSKEIHLTQLMSIDKAIDAILMYSSTQISLDDHEIVFLSDHGSSYLDTSSTFNRIQEKHSALFSIWNPSLEPHIRQQLPDSLSICSFMDFHRLLHEEDILSFVRQHDESEGRYSQIFYPNSHYEFFFFYESVIYKYRSFERLPSRQHFLNELSSSYFCNGNWEVISKSDGSRIIDIDDVPEEVIEAHDKIREVVRS